eukprot:6183344-Pleurochrysis_carterae.AAC.5
MILKPGCTPMRDLAKTGRLGYSQMRDTLPTVTPKMTLVCRVMPFFMPTKSAEVAVTARDTGQAFSKCPETVPAQAATSHKQAGKSFVIGYTEQATDEIPRFTHAQIWLWTSTLISVPL